MRDKLLIGFANNQVNELIVEFLKPLAKEIEVVLHKNGFYKDKVPDLIIFTKEVDIDPSYYGESKHKNKNTNSDDNEDTSLHNFYHNYSYIPKVGFGKGAELLSVFNGCKLIQSIDGHLENHPIRTIENYDIQTTSNHDQMIYPFNIDKNNYELLAWSKFYKSSKYINGKGENVKLHKDFLEPEILYFTNYNSLVFQGHPELNEATEDYKKYCLHLIKTRIFKEGSFFLPSNHRSFSFSDFAASNGRRKGVSFIKVSEPLKVSSITKETIEGYLKTISSTTSSLSFGSGIDAGATLYKINEDSPVKSTEQSED